MKLSSILSKKLIFTDLSGKNKKEIIQNLVGRVCEVEQGLNRDKIFQCVMEREEQMSTGFENGVAIPHSRLDFMQDFIVAIGLCKQGVDFNSIDGKPSRIFVLILACKKKNSFMLQTLYALSTFFSEECNREKILCAQSSCEIFDIIENSDVVLKKELIASDIMTSKVYAITSDETIRKVCNLFTARRMRVIPVVSREGKLIGEISEKDVLKIGVPEFFGSLQSAAFLGSYEPFEDLLEKEDLIHVSEYMNTDIAIVSPDTHIMEVAFKLVIKEFERVYVLEKGELIGVISKTDLINRIMNG